MTSKGIATGDTIGSHGRSRFVEESPMAKLNYLQLQEENILAGILELRVFPIFPQLRCFFSPPTCSWVNHRALRQREWNSCCIWEVELPFDILPPARSEFHLMKKQIQLAAGLPEQNDLNFPRSSYWVPSEASFNILGTALSLGVPTIATPEFFPGDSRVYKFPSRL